MSEQEDETNTTTTADQEDSGVSQGAGPEVVVQEENSPVDMEKDSDTPNAEDSVGQTLDIPDAEQVDLTPTPSTEDLAYDSEEDGDSEIDKMLSELEGFQMEMERVSRSIGVTDTTLQSTSSRPVEIDQASQDFGETDLSQISAEHPLDDLRFSLCAIEGSGEVDLDALLEDLCVMEKEMNSATDNDVFDETPEPPADPTSPVKSPTKLPADVRFRLESLQEEMQSTELTPEQQQEKLKAEKMKIALEKIREARNKKLVVKIFNDEDPTSKTLLIDQTWTAWDVCKKMMKKNDSEPNPNWAIVETLEDFSMERLLEDHECVVDVVSRWPWDTKNKLIFTHRRDKYAVFRNPQNYLLSAATTAGEAHLAEKTKDILLQEYFQKDCIKLPEVEGVLSLREGKKSWKKHFFILRPSGVYYTPKGKTKSHKDLVCLIKFENALVYYGLNSRKKHKAPNDNCFVLKHQQLCDPDSKHVKYLCTEDRKTMLRWTVGIRIAQYGFRMMQDYNRTQDEMDKLTLTMDRARFPKPSSQPQEQLTSEETFTPSSVDTLSKPKSQTVRGPQNVSSAGMTRERATISGGRPPVKPPAKSLGNLFSDAWRKGTEVEIREKRLSDPIATPATPTSIASTPSCLNTPDTTTPKTFHIDLHSSMEQISEENTGYTPDRNSTGHSVPLLLQPPPPRRKSEGNGSDTDSGRMSDTSSQESLPPPPPDLMPGTLELPPPPPELLESSGDEREVKKAPPPPPRGSSMSVTHKLN